MQNPSHGVAQPLQNHVHLISGHRFPLTAQLGLDQAFHYLIDAPQIVKQIAPMSWNYITAPQDGTVWLEWLPPDKMGPEGRFPSDGYVWADNETPYRHDFNGYTIEMITHSIGFRHGFDHMANHARTRYHFVAKNPSVNAAPPDPALWLVHYHHADRGQLLPSNQVPFTPQMHQIMSERKWLESQGRLEKKDFMLHDRGSWPIIQVPGSGPTGMHARAMQQPGIFGNMQPNRYPGYYPQGHPGAPGQPQPKRQRPNQSISGAITDGLHDTSIEDEENTATGDFFDHLTPRDISMTRYMQHHRWMEEVFSSPYSSRQIVPTDLGLGLMGELKGLTDGILEPPSMEFSIENKPPKAKEAEPFTSLKKEQIDEFNKRVEKHIAEGQAEIERMKAEHAAKMSEWKTTKTMMQAEQKLRFATWEGHESAVPAYRLESQEVLGAKGADVDGKKNTVEEIVKEVESMLGIKISPHSDVNMVEKGGFQEEDQQRPQPVSEPQRSLPSQQQQQQQQQQQSGSVASGEPAEMYHGDPMPTPGSKPKFDASPAAAQPTPPQQSQTPGTMPSMAQPQADDLGDADMNADSMLEGLDGMDMDNTEFNFDATRVEGLENLDSAVLPAETLQPAASEQNAAASANASGTAPAQEGTSASTFGGDPGQAPTAPPEPAAQSTSTPAEGTTTLPTDADLGGDNSMFDSTTDAFADLGGDGDGLIDFGESGGMGSAFDDAMPDMEGHQ